MCPRALCWQHTSFSKPDVLSHRHWGSDTEILIYQRFREQILLHRAISADALRLRLNKTNRAELDWRQFSDSKCQGCDNKQHSSTRSQISCFFWLCCKSFWKAQNTSCVSTVNSHLRSSRHISEKDEGTGQGLTAGMQTSLLHLTGPLLLLWTETHFHSGRCANSLSCSYLPSSHGDHNNDNQEALEEYGFCYKSPQIF